MELHDNILCCGVRELSELSLNNNFDEALIDLMTPEEYYDASLDLLNPADDGFAFVIFSGVTDEEYGQKFAAFLKQHKLGQVVKSPSRRNPNTDNMITVWTWAVNRRNLTKWYNKRKEAVNVD